MRVRSDIKSKDYSEEPMTISSIFKAFVNYTCSSANGVSVGGDFHCCSCRDEDELLTAGLRERLEAEGSAYAAKHFVPPPVVASSPAVSSSSSPENTSTKIASGCNRSRTCSLEVPEAFDNVRMQEIEKDYVDEDNEMRQDSLRKCITHFNKSLVRGICMSVLLDDGRTLLTDASLDSDLTHLVLYVPKLQHPVALSSIESVTTPGQVMTGDVLSSNQALLDERCTTLIIRGGQFLTFVFETQRIRQYFELCLKVLILSKTQEEAAIAPSNPGPLVGNDLNLSTERFGLPDETEKNDAPSERSSASSKRHPATHESTLMKAPASNRPTDQHLQSESSYENSEELIDKL